MVLPLNIRACLGTVPRLFDSVIIDPGPSFAHKLLVHCCSDKSCAWVILNTGNGADRGYRWSFVLSVTSWLRGSNRPISEKQICNCCITFFEASNEIRAVSSSPLLSRIVFRGYDSILRRSLERLHILPSHDSPAEIPCLRRGDIGRYYFPVFPRRYHLGGRRYYRRARKSTRWRTMAGVNGVVTSPVSNAPASVCKPCTARCVWSGGVRAARVTCPVSEHPPSEWTLLI